MRFSKQRVIDDPAYLAWARAQPCFSCGVSPAGEAHHTIHKGMGGANVRDDMAVPACRRCHMRAHGLVVEGKPPIAALTQREAARAARRRYLVGPAPSDPRVPLLCPF